MLAIHNTLSIYKYNFPITLNTILVSSKLNVEHLYVEAPTLYHKPLFIDVPNTNIISCFKTTSIAQLLP